MTKKKTETEKEPKEKAKKTATKKAKKTKSVENLENTLISEEIKNEDMIETNEPVEEEIEVSNEETSTNVTEEVLTEEVKVTSESEARVEEVAQPVNAEEIAQEKDSEVKNTTDNKLKPKKKTNHTAYGYTHFGMIYQY